MVKPDNRAGIVGSGAGAFRYLPDVSVGCTGGDQPVVSWVVGTVIVVGTLGIFFVEDSVGMHAVALSPIVLEKDLDGVADLGMHRRAEQSKMLPLWRALLDGGKTRIGVFVINRLAIDPANSVLTFFGPHH